MKNLTIPPKYQPSDEPNKRIQEHLAWKAPKIEKRRTVQKTPEPTTPTTYEIDNPQDYILLGENLLVSKYRLGMSERVDEAGKKLGLTLENSATEQTSKREYIGNINRNQALALNQTLGGRTLNPGQFADFYLLLKSGQAQDGTGRQVPKEELENILDEIFTIRDPWRSEWIDADFKVCDSNGKVTRLDSKAGQMYLLTDHKLDAKGNLISQTGHNIQDHYSKESQRFDFNDLDKTGIPSKKGSDFTYWRPSRDNNSVARFNAVSGNANLVCNWYPSYAFDSLGVRLVCEAHAPEEKEDKQ